MWPIFWKLWPLWAILLALVTYLKNHGKKVFIFSSKNNISQELRTGADGYTDILDIEDIWGKELKHRAELEKRA